MKHTLVLIILWLGSSAKAVAQCPNFYLLTISNDSTSTMLKVGWEEGASDCADVSTGESELPPLPPPEVFDVRLIDWSKPESLRCFGYGQLVDIRDRDTSRITVFEIRIQPGTRGYPVEVKATNLSLSWVPLISMSAPSIPQPIDLHIDSIMILSGPQDSIITITGKIGACVLEGVAEPIPQEFKLYQNYPNPFNPVTRFPFSVAEFGHVSLKVFDLLGREVATIVDEAKPPGSYDIEWNAAMLPTGVYTYRLRAGEFSSLRRLVLIR